MDQKVAFAERLKNAMLAAGYEPRPAVLERGFNQRYWGRSVTFQAVRRWLNGESIPAQDKLEVLAEWLRIEPQTLRYGVEAVARVHHAQAGFEKTMSYPDREIVDVFLNLPTEQKKIVREVILAFAKATTPAQK